MELDCLTKSQKEQLDKFREVSFIKNDDMALAIMRQANWIVSVALDIAFSMDANLTNPDQPQEATSIEEKDLNESTREVVPQATGISRSDPWQGGLEHHQVVGESSWLDYIVKRLYSLTSYVFSFIPEAVLSWLPSWLYEYKVVAVATGSIDSPLRQFRMEYGSMLPNFTDAPLSTLMAHVTTNPLFLYFHCRNHEHTSTFVDSVLSNTEVVDYLNNNFVSWFGSSSTQKDVRLAAELKITAYPYVCVLSPRQGRADATRFNLLFQHGGPTNAESLLTALKNAQDCYQMELARSVAQDLQIQDDRELRVEQELEYSKMIDEEKKRIDAKKAEELARIDEEEKRNALIEAKIIAVASLPKEPDEDEAGLVRARIRFPDGSTKQRRFLDSNIVDDVFNYVISCELEKKDKQEVVTEFELISSFPRVSLSKDNAKETLKSLGLINSMNLHVNTGI